MRCSAPVPPCCRPTQSCLQLELRCRWRLGGPLQRSCRRTSTLPRGRDGWRGAGSAAADCPRPGQLLPAGPRIHALETEGNPESGTEDFSNAFRTGSASQVWQRAGTANLPAAVGGYRARSAEGTAAIRARCQALRGLFVRWPDHVESSPSEATNSSRKAKRA